MLGFVTRGRGDPSVRCCEGGVVVGFVGGGSIVRSVTVGFVRLVIIGFPEAVVNCVELWLVRLVGAEFGVIVLRGVGGAVWVLVVVFVISVVVDVGVEVEFMIA